MTVLSRLGEAAAELPVPLQSLNIMKDCRIGLGVLLIVFRQFSKECFNGQRDILYLCDAFRGEWSSISKALPR